MTEATTESQRPRRGLSVRSRITFAVAALTAMAMVLVGALLQALSVASMYRDESGDLSQEFQEFRKLQSEGYDPETGEPFTPRTLLERFLQRNVPDDDEITVTYLGGETHELSAGVQRRDGGSWQDWLQTPGYREAAERVVDEGGRTKFEDPEYGEVWVSAVPVRVRGGSNRGDALVIATLLQGEREELNRTLQLYGATSLAALGVAALLAWLLAGKLLAPIRVLRQTTEEIGSTDLSQRIPEYGNDDLTDLTRTVNGMLERLEEGFEGQRRFLDDAGHELRTPLTVMGGHLELMDPDRPEDVRETQALLLEETERMSRLVGDLILLAKSRRPDFVDPHPTDLPELVAGIHAKASALGDRTWQLDSRAHGTAYLDAQRITQALLQLADNAVKHTDPGDTITIGADRTADRLRLWVADTGDGIPAQDVERIFDRFARSGVRSGDEGFGLGLSIVNAVVREHGGTIDVESAPGWGTTMTIILPTEEDTWPTS
ncbi:sensor histidine kinase [Nocardioides rotundus]|uniref:sensor histidine kinase n=1 Tax=Nocardioides rotundus TaxID=1774216 RepID=UPI001CC094E0|nr:HAMP domain-containing sensor histidine kinase [Nocardioides rotundus]